MATNKDTAVTRETTKANGENRDEVPASPLFEAERRSLRARSHTWASDMNPEDLLDCEDILSEVLTQLRALTYVASNEDFLNLDPLTQNDYMRAVQRLAGVAVHLNDKRGELARYRASEALTREDGNL